MNFGKIADDEDTQRDQGWYRADLFREADEYAARFVTMVVESVKREIDAATK